MMKRFCLFVLIAVLYSTGANATEPPANQTVVPAKADFSDLRLASGVVVRRVIDPLRMQLGDGQILQLSGIDIPDMSPQDPGDIPVAATMFLKQLLENKQCRLYQTKDADTGRVNRMGYVLGHLESQDDIWIQGILLANGLARVYPSVRNPELAAQMLLLENQARMARLGLWADPRFAALTPETAGQALHNLAVVEGTVRGTATSNNHIFLNFGPDWHTDFTIGIDSGVRRAFNEKGVNPLDFTGRKLRVHGWVEDYNGPYISLLGPAWLEFIPE